MNDAYATYRELGSPNQLTKAQVDAIKKANDGSPVSVEDVEIKEGIRFYHEFDMRENDVYLVKLEKNR